MTSYLVEMDERELVTTLVALRCFQAVYDTPRTSRDEFPEYYDADPRLEPLDKLEIDSFCARVAHAPKSAYLHVSRDLQTVLDPTVFDTREAAETSPWCHESLYVVPVALPGR